MKFFTNSEFSADIADIIREYFPNEKLEKAEADEDCQLSFFVEKFEHKEEYICKFGETQEKDELLFDDNWSILQKKRFTKRKSKICVYNCLSKAMNKTLAWGSLTGIRPTKLAYELKKEGEADTLSAFENIFKVPHKKAKLVDDILQNQSGLINLNDDNYADFYINIPFCVSRCSYCSFVSGDISKQKHFIEPYINALCHEIEETKKMIKDGGYKINHLYIGGGTPTSFNVEDLEKILSHIDFEVDEFTVEAGRPDTITKEKLELFKKAGVNRISINPQTFEQKTLDLINRRHTITDIYVKFELARQFGFEINMDLIAGLPGETFENFKNSIDSAVALKPENITVHTLALKSGSQMKEESKVSDNENEIEKMLDYASEKVAVEGFVPYYMYRQKYVIGNFENVGYCLPGKQCKYNIDMMEEVANIFACGANAISKRVFLSQNRIERAPNVKDFTNYIERIDEMIDRKKRLFLG